MKCLFCGKEFSDIDACEIIVKLNDSYFVCEDCGDLDIRELDPVMFDNLNKILEAEWEEVIKHE